MKLITTTLAAVALAVSLTACGGSDDSDDSDDRNYTLDETAEALGCDLVTTDAVDWDCGPYTITDFAGTEFNKASANEMLESLVEDGLFEDFMFASDTVAVTGSSADIAHAEEVLK